MATTYKPPASLLPSLKSKKFSVFLADSVETDSALNWQAEMERNLADLDIVIYSPQSADNLPPREQVEWELDAMILADLVVMHLTPGASIPFSFLKLGLQAAHSAHRSHIRYMGPFRGSNIIVFCSSDFQFKEHVDVICDRYSITRVNDISKLEEIVRNSYNNFNYNQRFHGQAH